MADIRRIAPAEAIGWQQSRTPADIGILDCFLPSLAFGAFEGSQMVGAVTYRPGHLIGVLVAAEHRRRGVGRALIEEALSDVAGIGSGAVRADTNQASGRLIAELPPELRARVYERGWYD